MHTDNDHMTLISVYSSPADDIQKTLEDLQQIISSLPGEKLLIGADLNGKHTFWSYNDINTRGNAILDIVLTNKLFIVNSFDVLPSLLNSNGTWGWPDLTICTRPLVDEIKNWEVLDEVSNSNHLYIQFKIETIITSHAFNRLVTLHGNHKKFIQEFKPHVNRLLQEIAQATDQVTINQNTIIQSSGIQYPKYHNSGMQKGIQDQETTDLHERLMVEREIRNRKEKINALRRRAQRTHTSEIPARFLIWKEKLAKYMREVRRSKGSSWKDLCTSASSPCGRHYKGAFRKTVFLTQLTVLENYDPQGGHQILAQSLLDTLFPFPTAASTHMKILINTPDDRPFTHQEVSQVIKSLPHGKAPGYDGIDNLVLKTMNRDENTVFQAEVLALKKAIQYATYITSHQPIKILTDNKARIQASTNPKTHNATARQLFETLLEHPQIELQWIKAHAGYLDNEAADQLAKEAAESDMTPLIIKLPKCHLTNVLRAMMINAWQKNRDEGKTEGKVHDILPKVWLSPSNWGRDEVLFFTGHGTFQYFLKRFHLTTLQTEVVGKRVPQFTMQQIAS
ncbi:hypothetical protein AVEN_252228-1 [Araneus ventricosus]|uniref:RNase H type-1 domain-containing protein n=1 Tax=Araneus ventricosus TaxID=182803 RepID=A0A4Y2JA01_ARAVE|nr:hypothetical protein AVEN_252228-1 [Araneus ventricosus]